MLLSSCCVFVFFFFKQKPAYEMRISDWSSDVCSSDLTMSASARRTFPGRGTAGAGLRTRAVVATIETIAWSARPLRTTKRAPSGGAGRSEELRAGKEGVSTFRLRRSPYTYKKKTIHITKLTCIQ